MTAIQEAKAMFAARGISFERELAYYLAHGVVLSCTDRFMMAKAINSQRGDDEWDVPDADCWYVHFATGKECLRWFLGKTPYPLPYVAWRRERQHGNRLKCYPTAAFARLVK